MRTIKRKTKVGIYSVGDRVVTVHGEGWVTCIFPNGPHRKATYAVKLGRRRIGAIFDEDEISMLRKFAPRSVEAT